MTKNEDYKLPLTSADLTRDVVELLREAAPQLFSESKIDFDKLKELLGGQVETGTERYGLNWAGKVEAFRNVQAPSIGTLLPKPGESVDWDNTENLIIEGDNLEVLKLLQKPYHGQVKMIYIDPPYNTGNEFIYPDNYREGLQDYLRYSGQVSEEGFKQTTNTETGGRFHSKWLSMMYPRLFLARNLLKEDGVIFVSIDDNEVHNLRMLMNEVFGEENFVASFVRKRRMPTGMSDTEISSDHEYVVTFARSIGNIELIGRTLQESDYPFQDNESTYRSTDLTIGMTKEMRPNQYYAITNTKTGNEYWPPEQRVWRFEPGTMAREISKNNIIWPDDFLDSRMSRPRYKTRFNPEKTSPVSTWINSSGIDESHTDTKTLVAGMNQEGTRELRAFFDAQLLEYPKPVSLIKSFVGTATKSGEGEIILDFFAGSGTTAQAVLELNREDGGNRKFILVQLPEKTEKSAFPTIAHITRERVRRVIAKLKGEGQIPPSPPLSKGGTKMGDLFAASELEADVPASLPPLRKGGGGDLGFRAFTLSSSNFKIWHADQPPATVEALAEQLKLYADNVDRQRSREDILFELLLKSGLPLSSKIEHIEIPSPLTGEGQGGGEVGLTTTDGNFPRPPAPSRQGRGSIAFSIAEGTLLICLENPISHEILRSMMERKTAQILCLDTAFHGNDPLKTNIVLEAKAHGILFRTV